MATCQYCGRELRCTGGYYYPVFEKCSCGGEERAREEARRKSEEFSRQLAEKQASCNHEWRICVQDNYGYERCPKCGKTRPIGGGSW